MVKNGIIKHFGKLISKAEQRIIEAYKNRRIETEPSITDRFLNEIERIFDENREKYGIVFRARTLRDRGRKAPEHIFGADFCGVLDINLENFRQSKGFLSQAKREGNGIFIERKKHGLTTVSFSQNNRLKKLNKQVCKMLEITPDSFVFVYSPKGFLVVPASSIKELKANGELYGKPVSRFFKEYLMCFIGDCRLEAHDDNTLESLRKKTNARAAIMFQIHEKWKDIGNNT